MRRAFGIRFRFACLAALALTGFAQGATEHWVKVQSPHFTVLTPASKKEAERWAVTMERFFGALVSGIGTPPGPLPVVTVVIFRRDRDFEPYKPLENGKPARVGGYFSRIGDVNVIGLSLEHEDEELQRTIQHESVHWFFSPLGSDQPLWLKEGLAEAYSTFRVVDKHHGAFGDPIEHHLALLRSTGLMPLPELLSATQDTIQFNEIRRTGIFYAESWLLVHYLVFNDPHAEERVAKYIGLTRRGDHSERAFTAAFGRDPTDFQSILQSYLSAQSFRESVVPLDDAKIALSIWSSVAREGDVEMALGSLLIGTRDRSDASRHLMRAARLLPGEPRPWECIGQLDLHVGDTAAAAGAYLKAAELGSKNYAVYYNFALARLGYVSDNLNQVPMSVAGNLIPSLNALREAIKLNASLVPAYRALAWLTGNSVIVSKQDLDLLKLGEKLAPGDPLIEVGLGAAEIKTGDDAAGRKLLRAIAASKIGTAPFAKAILQFEDLRALDARLESLFAKHQYSKVGPAIAAFQVDDPERASAEWDRLQKIKQKAEAAMTSPNQPAAR